MLERTDYESILTRAANRRLEELVDFMINLPYFTQWSRTAMRKICPYYQTVHYAKGEIVYRRGEPCRYVYVISSGEFEMLSDYNISVKKERELVTLIGPPKRREALRQRYARVGIKGGIGLDHIEVTQTLQVS